MEKWKKKLNKNTNWILFLGFSSTFGMIRNVYETFREVKLNFINMLVKDLPIFQLEFWNNVMQVATVIILWRVYKKYMKLSDSNSELTMKLSDSNNELPKKLSKRDDYLITKINEINEHWFTQISKVSNEITDNLNDLQHKTNLKVQYTLFYANNKDLPSNQYYHQLKKEFSIDDLQDIGINENFIKEAKGILLPRNVFDKIKDVELEYYNYKKIKDGE